MTASKTCASETEEIFQVVGTYGPWQRKVTVLVFLINFSEMWHSMALTFTAPNMEFKCSGTGLQIFENSSSTFSSRNDSSNNTSSYATYFSRDQCQVIVWRNQTENFTSLSENETSVKPCTRWKYDLTFYQQTIVSEWDLVCDKEWLISLAKSMYMVGYMVSVFVFGQMADWIGRYPTAVVCYVISVVSCVLSAFSQSYIMFVILRFFKAFGVAGLTVAGYVLLMEIVGPDERKSLGITIQLGWTAGLMTLPALAWFVRPWAWQELALVAPFVPLICLCWMFPESPRWLKTQKNREKFEEVVAKACKQNGRDHEFDVDSLMSTETSGKEQTDKVATILDLVRTPRMRTRSICTCYLWLVNTFVYYNISYNTNDLGGDPYLNVFLSAVMEVGSNIAVYFAIRIIGRKLPLIVGMLVGGVSSAVMMAVPLNMHWLIITVSMIGRFCISGTFAILYLYTAEMYPTVVRNIALGSFSAFARVGSIVAPFSRELGKFTHYTAPNGLNAALAITSGLLAFLLPETKGSNPPDTLEEGENFAKSTGVRPSVSHPPVVDEQNPAEHEMRPYP